MVINGTPLERGRAYGKLFADDIRGFLEREIYSNFIDKSIQKDELQRFAGACAARIKKDCPEVHEELIGVAEGSALSLEECTLITLHEELYHRGVLPKVDHCTAVAVGPPDTEDGRTYVGQTWDWMESVFGLSRVLEWKRTQGPSVLAYGFPGLWIGAGLNSAGLALTWTSADLGNKALGVRVGVSSYSLLTHFLYQESLDAVKEEAKRIKNAGWFTFVMGDGEGNLLNIEGNPEGMVTQECRGRLVRVGFGTYKMTGVPENGAVPFHPRCQKMYSHLQAQSPHNSLESLQRHFADRQYEICVGKSTIDMMVFDTRNRIAHLSRGPEYNVEWKQFEFGSQDGKA